MIKRRKNHRVSIDQQPTQQQTGMDKGLNVNRLMTWSTPIDDPEDPRVEPFRAIRERDLVGRQGRFVGEGELVLRVLLQRSPHSAEAILVSPNRSEALADLLSGASCPIYVAAQPVIDSIAGFSIHRGVLAVGRRGPLLDTRTLLARAGPEALVLCLVGLANHDNVGAAFRNAAAFGAAAVILDRATCDPLYRKAIRVSAGASLFTPFARSVNAGDLIDDLEAAGFTPFALSPRGLTAIADVVRPKRAALVLGTEGPGLPDAIMSRCQTVSIPMAPGFDSLNVATAGAVALHRLAQL
jgi:tRNA G18 (ribose-2'-O)-methylase SpoU